MIDFLENRLEFYSLSIFSEIDIKKIQKIFDENNITLDNVSAYYYRIILNQIINDLKKNQILEENMEVRVFDARDKITKKYIGKFHQFGIDSIETNDGIVTFTAAVVENKNGEINLEHADCIQFLKNESD